MSRFRYSLEAALECLKSRERSEHKLLATAEAALIGERAVLADLDTCGVGLRQELATSGPTVAAVFAEIDRRLDALHRARAGAAERVAGARRATARARVAFRRAMCERSALERHRARKYDEFLVRGDLREAAELDESNALRSALSQFEGFPHGI